jgi:hypothetical protein
MSDEEKKEPENEEAEKKADEYPEHEKLKKIGATSQAFGEFLEWLQNEKRIRLCTTVEGDDELRLVHTPITDWLAQYFEIDLKKLEEEKRAMLEKFKSVIMPKHKAGTRVMAVSHTEDDKVFVFGLGEYIGDKAPGEGFPEPIGMFAGNTNPCIKLDSGQYVWGCECWWGPVDAVKQKFGDREEVVLDIDKRREEIRAQQEEEETDG